MLQNSFLHVMLRWELHDANYHEDSRGSMNEWEDRRIRIIFWSHSCWQLEHGKHFSLVNYCMSLLTVVVHRLLLLVIRSYTKEISLRFLIPLRFWLDSMDVLLKLRNSTSLLTFELAGSKFTLRSCGFGKTISLEILFQVSQKIISVFPPPLGTLEKLIGPSASWI